MVIPLRTISYGIPILVVGILAALPFRRVPQAEPIEASKSPPAGGGWEIEPIQEVPVAELPAWDRERLDDSRDPMQSLAESMPPLPESYQAVAIPLDKPAKIAERFSAVARDTPRPSDRAQPPRPLVGHLAAFGSTNSRQRANFPEPNPGWKTAIPIGRPPHQENADDEADPANRLAGQTGGTRRMSSKPTRRSAAAASSPILPPPRPKKHKKKDAAESQEPWPTLSELAGVKRASEASHRAAKVPNAGNVASGSSQDDTEAVRPLAAGPRAADSSGQPLSIRGPSDDARSDRQRFFIREPTSDRG